MEWVKASTASSSKTIQPEMSVRRGPFGLALVFAIFGFFTNPIIAADVTTGNPALVGIWLPDSADYRDQLPKELPYSEAGHEAVRNYNHADDPVLKCLQDWGRISTVSFPLEIIAGDRQVTLLYEYGHNVRRAFMDRDDFSANYPPSLMGYSIGYWDKDVLVVETAKLMAGQVYEQGIAPYSADVKITERFILSEDDAVLTIERTIDDPVNYTHPWTWTRELTRSEWDIFPYDCTVGSYGSSLQ
jgi:hypothetical protein